MSDTPWMNCKETAQYLQLKPAFVRSEVNAGRLKAARVGSRRRVFTRREWCDEWMQAQAEVQMFRPRRVL